MIPMTQLEFLFLCSAKLMSSRINEWHCLRRSLPAASQLGPDATINDIANLLELVTSMM